MRFSQYQLRCYFVEGRMVKEAILGIKGAFSTCDPFSNQINKSLIIVKIKRIIIHIITFPPGNISVTHNRCTITSDKFSSDSIRTIRYVSCIKMIYDSRITCMISLTSYIH